MKKATFKSEMMQWGDVSFGEDTVAGHEGGGVTSKVRALKSEAPATGAVSARQVGLHRSTACTLRQPLEPKGLQSAKNCKLN